MELHGLIMPTTPNRELLADEGVPRITLGGVEWPVPKLAIAQNAYVEPLIRRHLPAIVRITRTGVDNAKAVKGGADAGDIVMSEALTPKLMVDLATVAFHALRRGHKSLTRKEFDDMSIMWEELYAAVFVIGKQSGLFKSDTKQKGVSAPAIPLAVTTTEAAPTG